MAATILCVLYGGLTMFTTGLYKRDAFVSENLITSGPFSLHRNPYYASMAVGLSVPAIYVAALDSFSANPSFLSSALMLGGLACLFRAAHKRVLRDEKSLEAAFGQKYLDYKKTTPRYFPSLIKRTGQKEE